MIRSINRIADRALRAMLPKSTAAAACYQLCRGSGLCCSTIRTCGGYQYVYCTGGQYFFQTSSYTYCSRVNPATTTHC